MIILTVNGIWGWGGSTPPVARFFLEKYRQIVCVCFILPMLLKFCWLALEKFQGSSFPRELPRDVFLTGDKRKSPMHVNTPISPLVCSIDFTRSLKQVIFIKKMIKINMKHTLFSKFALWFFR